MIAKVLNGDYTHHSLRSFRFTTMHRDLQVLKYTQTATICHIFWMNMNKALLLVRESTFVV